MFRGAKERDLEKSEKSKIKEINKILSEFTKPEPTRISVLAPPVNDTKVNSVCQDQKG